MYITLTTDGNGEVSFIVSKNKESKRVKDLETDGASIGYETFKIEEDELYLVGDGLHKLTQGEKLSEDDEDFVEYDWDEEDIKPIVKKECNECGGTLNH